MDSDDVSQLLLGLYRELPDQPATEYIEHAFGVMAKVLKFDSGYVCHGTVDAVKGLKVSGINLYRQPVEKLVEYGEVSHLDSAARRAAQRPGVALSHRLMDLIPRSNHFEPIRQFARRHQVAHALSIALPWSDEYVAGVSLSRASDACPYTEHDRQLASLLLPHLVQARKHKLRLSDAAWGQQPLKEWQAMCTLGGCLAHCPPDAVALMQAEWPQWQPPVVPGPLLEALGRSRPPSYVGRHIAVTASVLGRSLVLRIRSRAVSLLLSPAQREVAALVVRGLAYKEVAKHLGLSDNTVRNHLTAVYRKLGVRNKTELALRWQQEEQWDG